MMCATRRMSSLMIDWLEPSVCYHCSVAKSCLTLCNPMGCSTPGFLVLYSLLELAQTHVHCVHDAIQTGYGYG